VATTHQWSGEKLADPFIAMPPATRLLRDLLVQGNPAPREAFEDVGMGENYLGLAAITRYRHRNRVTATSTAALAWHYDKSLGIETACVSVPIAAEDGDPTTIVSQGDEGQGGGGRGRGGHKTIGLGGANPVSGGCGKNVPGQFRTMPMPVNSFWLANAKAVYHAVGNDDAASATLVFRTQVSREKYEALFFPTGARHVSRLLRKVQLRFFPVLGDDDVERARAALAESYP
jgi:hypothetical protein